jgi:sortase system peptidoglycan-associated protein
MFNHLTKLALILSVFITQAYALDLPHTPSTGKENAGFGIGAIIGGLLGGPPGIVIGAAGGTWLGARDTKKDNEIVSLEKRLQDKKIEIAYLQSEFVRVQSQFAQDIQKVKLEQNRSALEQLSQGISLTVYFRTDSADINTEIKPRIKRLVELIREFPEISVQLEGHADRRGTITHNMELSKERIKGVQNEMVNAGLSKQRIQVHAYGESQAIATDSDIEGYIFDRRVTLHLTLDTEV